MLSRETVLVLTAEELQAVVDVLNNDVYEEDGDKLLTSEEVMSTPALSGFILDCLEEDSDVKHDPDEVWNMDGFDGWMDCRS